MRMQNDKPLLLLVEDSADFRGRMQQSFGRWYRLVQSPSLKAAALALQTGNYDLVLLDLSFDDGHDLEGLQHIRPFKRLLDDTPIIVVTKDQKSSTVVTALRAGADDYVRKDEFDIQRWRTLFDNHIQRHRTRIREAAPRQSTPAGHLFIGETPAIQQIKKYLTKLSSRPDISVLLLGETGVGKEIAARYLHEHGQRADKPFQAINLTAVSRELMESTLFGHRKGAFTDARADQQGAFEKAHAGILFLDEIGEIDHNIQVKLLRFLQDKIITPVGGGEIQLDVQVVAATNRDLKAAMNEGVFRADLYYRLSNFIVTIPPLRERREDIELLLDYYLRQHAGSTDVLTPAARNRLVAYAWPGNVRELVNTVKTLCVHREFQEVDHIDVELLPEEIRAFQPPAAPTGPHVPEVATLSEKNALSDLTAIEAALNQYPRKGQAAEALGLNLDQLKYKIDRYYEKYPALLDGFPVIKRKYKLKKVKP